MNKIEVRYNALSKHFRILNRQRNRYNQKIASYILLLIKNQPKKIDEKEFGLDLDSLVGYDWAISDEMKAILKHLGNRTVPFATRLSIARHHCNTLSKGVK